MNNQTKPNLIISGMGSSVGGNYHLVKIDGICKVSGGIECTDFMLNGKSSVKGGVIAKSIEINGDADLGGKVQTEKIKIYGKTEINGDLNAEEINITGALNVRGDCQAESFVTEGGFVIDGLLNAGNVDIMLYHNCKVKEIGGESIRVRKHGVDLLKFLKAMFVTLSPKLIVDTIEGDDIRLEYTKAAVVRGNNVVIGPGCEIQKVEYKETIDKDKGAKIANCVKL